LKPFRNFFNKIEILIFILFPNGRGFRQEGRSTGLPVGQSAGQNSRLYLVRKAQEKRREYFTPTLILPPQIGGGSVGKDGFPFSWE